MRCYVDIRKRGGGARVTEVRKSEKGCNNANGEMAFWGGLAAWAQKMSLL